VRERSEPQIEHVNSFVDGDGAETPVGAAGAVGSPPRSHVRGRRRRIADVDEW
jgi:hypothetical protein